MVQKWWWNNWPQIDGKKLRSRNAFRTSEFLFIANCPLWKWDYHTWTIHQSIQNLSQNNVPKRTGCDSIEVAWMKIGIRPFIDSVKYLGKELSFHTPTMTEIQHRRSCAWMKFYAQKEILCNKAYPLTQRLRLFDTTITPTILYGAGSWTMTSPLEHRLKKVQRQMLHSIFQFPRKKTQTNELSGQA